MSKFKTYSMKSRIQICSATAGIPAILSPRWQKTWVDNTSLLDFPLRTGFNTVPCFIGDAWVERYLHAAPGDRYAIWYSSVQENALLSKHCNSVTYEHLVTKPKKFSETICDFLRLELGP